GVEISPEIGDVRIVPHRSRSKSGVVPVCERARRGVGRKIGSQPRLLGRAGGTTAHSRAIGVESDQVPGTDVKRVVPAPWLAGGCAEILEVALSVSCRIAVG